MAWLNIYSTEISRRATMTQQDSPKQQNPDDQQGLPLPLKLLLAVMALGVLGMILKVAGIF
jgi:hypothetical protein